MDDAAYPKATRATDRARVYELDAQIHELEEKLRVLQTERAPYLQRLNSCKYPVLTLPNEIISEIFVHALPPYPSCPPMKGPKSPTHLNLICRKWRDVALGTPQLWRAITLPYTDDKQVDMVRTWLDRSRSCPLSIKLSWEKTLPRTELCEAILLHRQRWEHVHLSVADESEFALIEGTLPMLLSLSVKFDGSVMGHMRPVAQNYPRLESLALSNLECSVDRLPWSQLTSLTLSSRTDDCAVVLQAAVNLVELKLIDCRVDRVDVQFIRLETLILDYRYGLADFPRHMIHMFTLPALHTLQLCAKLLGKQPIDALSSFISRSGCRLRKVLITGKRKRIDSKELFRQAFPTIPKIAFNSDYDWYMRWKGDEEDSDDDCQHPEEEE
ncbi:hypothetical protein FB45DRAFT_45266 [Roridomyces roridus]|uniref:F-box domain-containing protein n=1 Tax=Roridomyces roridus TaxID=1738132 RepID=A0AAD7BS11_9AGAR|nr:hypothetical protein FB45DRAFT_45266 [Roridomyces roridus]